jgi:ribosomal protein S18 acetylase RimI-like enzyme
VRAHPAIGDAQRARQGQTVWDRPTAVEIRRYRPEDARRVWALSTISNIAHTADPDAPLPLAEADEPPANFPDLADITGRYIDCGGDFLIAEEDGHLVAMGSIRPNNAEQAEVNNIRVHPATRRRGFGRAVMSALEDSARRRGFRQLHLDTATNQPEAVAFYRCLGYEEVGRETRPDWTWTLVYFVKDL